MSLRQVLYTNLLLLRRHWADWQKWLDCSKNQFNGVITTVAVNGCLSLSFAFQFSSFQGTGGTKYRMSAFGKVEHHAFSSFIPFSIRFVEIVSVPFHLGSSTQKRPTSLRWIFEKYSVIFRAFAIQFSLFPRFPQSLSLYTYMKMMLPFNCSGSHFDSIMVFRISSRISNVVNLGKVFQSSSIGSPSIRSKSLGFFRKLFNLTFPCIDWQHWVRKGVGLGSCKLNSSFSQQSRLSLHIGSCQWIVVSPEIVCPILDQPLIGRSQVFRVLFTKMNCSLKSDRHQFSLCSHRGLSFDPSNCDHIFVSRSRRPSPCASHDLLKYGDCANFVIAFGSRASCVSWISWSDTFPCTYRIFRIVQVFLVFFCRDEFPRTHIQNGIFLSSLRTRRCVVIGISCVTFPRTWPICSTRCFEYNQVFDALGFCTVEELVETMKARFIVGFDFATILSFLFLHPYRHCFGAAS